MKKVILYELLRWIERTPNAKKKIFVALGVGAFVFLLVGGLVIWAGITALKSVAGVAQQAQVGQHLQTITQQAQQVSGESLSTALSSQCWQKAQGLLNVQAWLVNSAEENLRIFTSACLGAEETTCQGADCQEQVETI